MIGTSSLTSAAVMPCGPAARFAKALGAVHVKLSRLDAAIADCSDIAFVIYCDPSVLNSNSEMCTPCLRTFTGRLRGGAILKL